MFYHINELTTLYVSQQGYPNGLGISPDLSDRHAGPMRSLELAFRRVQEMRRGGMRQPVTIRILDDCYVVRDTIECPAGTENIVITGDRGDTLISGGVPLTGFQEIEKDGLRVFVTDLPRDAVPADLYVDGLRARWTRIPDQGAFEPEDVENRNPDLWAGSQWFIAKEEDLKGLDNIETMTVSFRHFWIDEHTPVAAFDPVTRKVTMKYRSRFSVYYAGTTRRWDNAHRMRYYFENVPRFTGPNQWYFDKKAGKVYYSAANESQTPDNIVAYLPQVKTMFRCRSNNVTLRGLTFSYNSSDYASDDCRNPGTLELLPQVLYASDAQSMSNGSGVVEFVGAANCCVEDCVFSHYGVYGVVGKFGSKRLRVTRNEFFDCGAGGVRLNGGTHYDCPEELTYGCVITDNVIHHIGRRFFAGCGILLMHTYDNEVSHNTIYDTFYSGISVGWVWGYGFNISQNNRIEYNHIHHVGRKKLSDMGAIYMLGRQPGTVIRNNLIHDVESAHYGGWGIYLDEGSSEMTVENNVVYNVTCNCFYLHFGQHNTVRNNIFYEANCSPVRYGDPELTIGTIMTNNILCTKGSPMVETDYGNNESHENLLYDYARPDAPVMLHPEKGEPIGLAEYQSKMQMEKNSLVADPGFADPEARDFTLSKDSPAFRMGFRPFSLKGVGARR